MGGGALVKKRIMMGKRELVQTLHARQPALSQEEIGAVVDGALALIVETVAQGGEVGLHGFGKFRPVSRTLWAVPAFAAGKHFLEALKKNPSFPPGDRR